MTDQFGDIGSSIEDTCPECGQPEVDQLLEDERIIRYICSSCGYDWQPYSKVEFGWIVVRKDTQADASEDEIRMVGDALRTHLDLMVSRAFGFKENKDG